MKKSNGLFKRFESALLLSILTLLLQITFLSCSLYFIVQIFDSYVECLFLAVLISSIDGSSIDESIIRQVDRIHFDNDKLSMLKLMKICSNCVIFLVC